jgi:hypothetical protein
VKVKRKKEEGEEGQCHVDDSCTTDDQRKNLPTNYFRFLYPTTSCATNTYKRLARTTPWYSSTKWACEDSSQ